METLLLLLALAAIAALVLGPAAFVAVVRARTRIDLLEVRLAEAEGRLAGLDGRSAPARTAQPPKWRLDPLPEAATDTPPTPASEPEPEPEPLAEPMAAAAAESANEPPEPPPVSAPARPKRSLEEALGARWSVWVGGVALGLGALLLVRYSIEQGFFGPGMRILSGLALAVALIAGGEFMRRRAPPDTERSAADVPAVLTAAGTVAAFGAIYAAHALYGFIGPGLAFAALTATGLACLFASGLHGPGLAALGLIGALAAPALVSSQTPTPWPILLHTAIVAGAAYALARIRVWLWLAVAAALGAAAWGGLLVVAIRGDSAAMFFAGAALHALIHMALAAVVFGWASLKDTPEDEAHPEKIALVMAGLFAVVLAGALLAGVAAGQYGAGWIAAAAAGVAILAATGFLLAPAAALLAGAGALALVALRIWPAPPLQPVDSYWSPAFDFERWPVTMDPAWFAGFALLAGAAVSLAGGWRLRVARALPFATNAIYAGAATLTPLALLVIAYVRMTDLGRSVAFAVAAAGVAFAFTAAANIFRNMEAQEPTASIRLGLGAFAAAAFAALALGLVFALEGGVLTVALALAALGAAHVAVRLDLAALRWCVAGLGLAVAARLAWEPRVVFDLGATPVFNWLLFGYGVPALAFGYAARLMRRHGGEDTPVRVAQSLTILFAALLTFFQIRHAMNGGDPFAPASALVEQGLFAVSALAFSIVLTRLDAARGSPVFRTGSYIAFGFSMLAIFVGLGVLNNPLFSFRGVEGGLILNGLLLGYAMPALLALALSILSKDVRPYWFTLLAKVAAMALAFGYVTLQTRRFFHEEKIGVLVRTTQAEWYAYSAVWLGLGVLLLAWGLVRGSREARLVSAGLVCLSVLKVFLFDMSGLEGPLRALSFIGLGLALIGIGLVYQKLVFRKAPDAPPSVPVNTPAA